MPGRATGVASDDYFSLIYKAFSLNYSLVDIKVIQE